MLEVEYAVKKSEYYSTYRKDILSLCPVHVNRVLDIGCGNGNTLEYLKSNGYCDWTCGVELFSAAAESAIKKVDQLYQSNIEDMDLPVAPSSIDMILCLDVLEHLVNPHKVIEYLHTLLSPGGVIIASIPNIRHISVTVPLIIGGKWEYNDSGILDRTHLRFFVKKTAIELMQSSGLQLLEAHPIPKGRKTKILQIITLGLLGSFLDSHYLIKVAKAS